MSTELALLEFALGTLSPVQKSARTRLLKLIGAHAENQAESMEAHQAGVTLESLGDFQNAGRLFAISLVTRTHDGGYRYKTCAETWNALVRVAGGVRHASQLVADALATPGLKLHQDACNFILTNTDLGNALLVSHLRGGKGEAGLIAAFRETIELHGERVACTLLLRNPHAGENAGKVFEYFGFPEFSNQYWRRHRSQFPEESNADLKAQLDRACEARDIDAAEAFWRRLHDTPYASYSIEAGNRFRRTFGDEEALRVFVSLPDTHGGSFAAGWDAPTGRWTFIPGAAEWLADNRPRWMGGALGYFAARKDSGRIRRIVRALCKVEHKDEHYCASVANHLRHNALLLAEKGFEADAFILLKRAVNIRKPLMRSVSEWAKELLKLGRRQLARDFLEWAAPRALRARDDETPEKCVADFCIQYALKRAA